ASALRFNHQFGCTPRGDENNCGSRTVLVDLLDDLSARPIRQSLIANDYVELITLSHREAVFSESRSRHLVSGGAQDLLVSEQCTDVIVDHEHAGHPAPQIDG